MSKESRAVRRALGMALLVVSAEGCTDAGKASACDGLSKRAMGITAREYAPCAAQIMSTLDTLGAFLDRYTQGDLSSRAGATRTYREVRALLRETGLSQDYRSARPGRLVERWPESVVRGFNSAVFGAVVQYMSALDAANRGIEGSGRPNFEEGSRLHREARQLYAQSW